MRRKIKKRNEEKNRVRNAQNEHDKAQSADDQPIANVNKPGSSHSKAVNESETAQRNGKRLQSQSKESSKKVKVDQAQNLSGVSTTEAQFVEGNQMVSMSVTAEDSDRFHVETVDSELSDEDVVVLRQPEDNSLDASFNENMLNESRGNVSFDEMQNEEGRSSQTAKSAESSRPIEGAAEAN